MQGELLFGHCLNHHFYWNNSKKSINIQGAKADVGYEGEGKELPRTSTRSIDDWISLEAKIDHPKVEKTKCWIHRALKWHGRKVKNLV